MSVPSTDAPPPPRQIPSVPRSRDSGDDRDAADRFAAAMRRHENPSEKQKERSAQPAKPSPPKAQSREEQKQEKEGGLLSGSSVSAPHAATDSGASAILDAATEIAAVPTEIVTPEKLGAIIDDLFISAEGDETLMMKFNNLFSPLEGVKVTRGEGGALGLHLTANAVHMPRLQAQVERLRERLLARGHRIDEIEIDTDSDPAARLTPGNARW